LSRRGGSLAYAATYDAWNRLAELKSGANVVLKCEYDGLGRRTKKHINTSSPLDQTYDEYQHFFYNAAWQILETRLSESENTGPETLQPEYQYVPGRASLPWLDRWSVRYIDAPVLRDVNTDSDDLCDDERLYYLNDANMNVTCLVEDDGDVAERYVYDPYGNCTVYDDDWSDTVPWANSKKNNIRFCGYYFDNETGLYNPRNRYYHPPLGRWMSREPAHYVQGYNAYEATFSNPAIFVDPDGRAAADTVGSANKPFRWREGRKEYRARWEAAPEGVWEKIAAGELDACPATLVLPDTIYEDLEEAWQLTLQTNQEQGGVITLVGGQFVTWGPVVGTEGGVNVEESAPPLYQKELKERRFGSYHTHPSHEPIVGQGLTSTPFSNPDVRGWWKTEVLALLRNCDCTYALLKIRRPEDPAKATDDLENEIAPYEEGLQEDEYLRGPTLADNYRRYKELQQERFSNLGRTVQKLGSCAYKACPGGRRDLTLVGQ